MSFFNSEILKGKPTKFLRIMPHLKISKNMFLEQKIWKKKKNYNSYGLMKIWSNFNHLKIRNYQTVKVFK